MLRLTLGLLLAGISTSSMAETLTFTDFGIDVASDWTHTVERGKTVGDAEGDLISIYLSGSSAVLKLQSYVAPTDVSRSRLRMLTNIDSSTDLTWQDWGDFSGYEYSYVERGSFFKQWWLLDQGTIIWATYETDADEQRVEIETIDSMIGSITSIME